MYPFSFYFFFLYFATILHFLLIMMVVAAYVVDAKSVLYLARHSTTLMAFCHKLISHHGNQSY